MRLFTIETAISSTTSERTWFVSPGGLIPAFTFIPMGSRSSRLRLRLEAEAQIEQGTINRFLASYRYKQGREPPCGQEPRATDHGLTRLLYDTRHNAINYDYERSGQTVFAPRPP